MNDKYKKYPKNFKDFYDLWFFTKKIKKYRYNCKKIKGRQYSYLYIKKEKKFLNSKSKCWKRKNYGDSFIHFYSGIQNKRNFKQNKKSIYDYSWEYNMFCLKNDEEWILRYTYYDLTFGKIRKFKTKRDIILFVRKIKKKNSYGLWHLEEYNDFLIV